MSSRAGAVEAEGVEGEEEEEDEEDVVVVVAVAMLPSCPCSTVMVGSKEGSSWKGPPGSGIVHGAIGVSPSP